MPLVSQLDSSDTRQAAQESNRTLSPVSSSQILQQEILKTWRWTPEEETIIRRRILLWFDRIWERHNRPHLNCAPYRNRTSGLHDGITRAFEADGYHWLIGFRSVVFKWDARILVIDPNVAEPTKRLIVAFNTQVPYAEDWQQLTNLFFPIAHHKSSNSLCRDEENFITEGFEERIARIRQISWTQDCPLTAAFERLKVMPLAGLCAALGFRGIQTDSRPIKWRNIPFEVCCPQNCPRFWKEYWTLYASVQD